MPALWSLILPALVPVLADGVRGIFNWVTGGTGAEPTNADEAIRIMDAEVRKLEAIAKLDAPAGQVSLWVANLRASFRYIAAGVIITPLPFLALYAAVEPTQEVVSFIELYVNSIAGPVFAFMFGDRLRLHFRKSA